MKTTGSKVLDALVEKHIKSGVTIDDYYHDSDGYWVELGFGWVCSLTETHTVHEDTVKEMQSSMKFVEKCKDPECECFKHLNFEKWTKK